MSSSDLPKLWAEPTKIGHTFRKQSALKSNVSKIFINNSWSPSLIFFTESERFGWFLMLKNDFESTNFANFEEVVDNFGRSDDDMI